VICREVREGLWPPERPRLLGPEVERAREHVRDCSECTRYFAQDRAVLDTCHRLRAVRAPLSVRARVFEALAQARRRPASSEQPEPPAERPLHANMRIAGGVALLVLFVLSGVVLGPGLLRDDPSPIEVAETPGSDAAFVEDYLRRAVGEDYLETSDPEEITRFLRRELGLQSRVLDLAGLIPRRVEICLLEGRRGAMVVYRLDGRTVTHYLVPKEAEQQAPRVAQEHGNLTVVTWSTDSLEEALVGEIPSDELLELARSGAGH
jgi:anti-sigma factor RsiW